MAREPFDPDPLEELRETAEAAGQLARDEGAFVDAYEAFLAEDSARFQSILDAAGIGHHCQLICVWFCTKRCVGTCIQLCPQRPDRPVDAKEVLEFTKAIQRVAKDKKALEKLVSIADAQDVRAWAAELKRLELTPFCHQVCRFICRFRCVRRCGTSVFDPRSRESARSRVGLRRAGIRRRAERPPFPGAAAGPG